MDRRLVTVALVVSLTTGCESLTKEKMGTISGAVLGAAGGAIVGGAVAKNKKEGMFVGAVFGAIAGGLIGNKIGQYLDEQDRKKHAEAVTKALETGQPQVWTSPDTGNSGEITVVDTPPLVPPPPPPAAQSRSRRSAPVPAPQTVAQAPHCRTTTQTIKLKNGETHTEELKACKGPNGWEAA